MQDIRAQETSAGRPVTSLNTPDHAAMEGPGILHTVTPEGSGNAASGSGSVRRGEGRSAVRQNAGSGVGRGQAAQGSSGTGSAGRGSTARMSGSQPEIQALHRLHSCTTAQREENRETPTRIGGVVAAPGHQEQAQQIGQQQSQRKRRLEFEGDQRAEVGRCKRKSVMPMRLR